MLFWKSRRLILAEADERMEHFGNEAYNAARAEAREARKRSDRKRDKFLSKVALEIANRTDFEPGLNTGTRYLENQSPYDAGLLVARSKDDTLH